MIRNTILFVGLIISQSLFLKGQESINKIHIDYTESNVYIEDCDTVNYYIIFENGFSNDKVCIYVADTLFEWNNYDTNPSAGVAGKVMIQNEINEKFFYLQINNSQKIPIFFDKEKKYIGVSFLGNYELFINYSKFLPMYY